MTTPEDLLFDRLCDIASEYLSRKRISIGVLRLAQVMQQAAIDHLDEPVAPNTDLVTKLAAAESDLSNFDRMIRAEQLRISILQAGTEPQS